MRTILRTLYAIMAIGAFAAASCQSAPSDDHAEKSTTTNPTQDSIPVLVLLGWMNGQEAVSSSEIRTGLQNGRVKITADLSGWVKDKFNIQGEVIQKENYPFASDSLLLLTTIDSTDGRWIACSVDGHSFFTEPKTYGWYCPSQHPFQFSKDITSYAHTGVTAITRQTGVVVQHEGAEAYLQNLMPYFQRPELLHLSNEVSAVDSCSYGRMKMSFATRTEHFALLEKLGADIIELTGNHNLDFGDEPYLKSLKWYNDNGMQYFGGGATPEEAKRPLIRTLKDGSKVAWIGFNERYALPRERANG